MAVLQYIKSIFLKDAEGNNASFSFYKGEKVGFVVPDASTTAKGVVQLEDTPSTATNKAPTSNALKTVQDDLDAFKNQLDLQTYEGEVVTGDIT